MLKADGTRRWNGDLAHRRDDPQRVRPSRSVPPPLDRLQPEHSERLYGALADNGLSPASILRVHRVISRALRVVSQRGEVARNVATLVDPPTVKRPQTALPLNAVEAKRVMATARAHRNAARWTVALAVGLRQSEALGLR
jgi:integrase